MKKSVVVLLVAAMLFSLSGCVMGKKNAIETAKELPVEEFYDDIDDNILVAEEKYSEDFYKVYGKVNEINREYVLIESNDIIFKVKFSKEDIKKLITGEYINFVGKFETIDEIDDELYVTVKRAYYIDNITEMECYIGRMYEDSIFLSNTYYYVYEERIAEVSLTQRIPEDMTIEPKEWFNGMRYVWKEIMIINGEEYKEGDKIYIKFIRKEKNDMSYILDIKKLEY